MRPAAAVTDSFVPGAPRDYEAYGLFVRSSIPLPFAPVHRTGEPDVAVRIGATPAALSPPVVKHTFRELAPRGFLDMDPPDAMVRAGAAPAALPLSAVKHTRELAPGAFLLTVDDVARYLVTNGRDVLVEPCGGSGHVLGGFLTGSVFAALLQQRGVVTLHASAIGTEAGAVLFTGRKGVGKSSLLGAFVRRGYAMLADDVTGVVLDAAGRPVALPAFPSMNLWADTLRALGWQGRRKVRPELEKYTVPVDRFRTAPLAVRAVFALEVRDRDGIEVRPVPAADALLQHWKSIYRERVMRGLGQLPVFFRTIAAMARRVPVMRVARPAHPFRLDETADRIEKHLRKG